MEAIPFLIESIWGGLPPVESCGDFGMVFLYACLIGLIVRISIDRPKK